MVYIDQTGSEWELIADVVEAAADDACALVYNPKKKDTSRVSEYPWRRILKNLIKNFENG